MFKGLIIREQSLIVSFFIKKYFSFQNKKEIGRKERIFIII